MIKNAGDPWGGAWIAMAGPMDFFNKQNFQSESFFTKNWTQNAS
jgi:hypothetical protein